VPSKKQRPYRSDFLARHGRLDSPTATGARTAAIAGLTVTRRVEGSGQIRKDAGEGWKVNYCGIRVNTTVTADVPREGSELAGQSRWECSPGPS
jgi:hypothetical protein